MPWGLSDKDIQIWAEKLVLPSNAPYVLNDVLEDMVKAIFRQVYVEGKRLCPHTEKSFEFPFGIPKRECPKCWAELKKAAGL